jgi:hypothetical protein
MIRFSPGSAFTAAALLLAACTEGGRGGYDCEPLARTFGPHGETFAALAEYRLSR